MNYPQFHASMVESGFSKKEIANTLGISEQALYNKLNGLTEFKNSEIKTISKLFNLTMDAVNIIFFDGIVNLNH